MRNIRLIFIVLLAGGCGNGTAGPTSAPPSGSSSASGEAAVRRFTQIMESNDVQLSALQGDAGRKAGLKAYQERIAALRKNAVEASTLRVLKSDGANDLLAREFEAYFATLDALTRDPWESDRAIENYKRVEKSCNHCHVQFQD